jgi:hypothetical protein
MSVPALRPLGVGEILDAGIKVYLGNARILMGLSAVVVVPFQMLNAVVLLSVVSSANEVPRGFAGLGARNAVDNSATLGAKVILSFTGLIVGVLVTAACVKAVSDAYLDQPVDLGASLRFAARRILSLVWLEILTLVLLAFAFAALLVPGIWLYAAWSVATPALLIEGLRGRHALRRSFGLVKGRWWPVAGVLVVAAVMVALISGAIEGVLLAIVLTSGGSVFFAVVVVTFTGGVASILTQPFQAAVKTILYYDLRVRREGYDVQLLAEQLGFDPAVMPAGAGPETPTWAPAGADAGIATGTPAAPGGNLPGADREDGPGARLGGGWGGGWGPDSIGLPGGPPFWPPPPGWSPPP